MAQPVPGASAHPYRRWAEIGDTPAAKAWARSGGVDPVRWHATLLDVRVMDAEAVVAEHERHLSRAGGCEGRCLRRPRH
jgi:hypothetical protein